MVMVEVFGVELSLVVNDEYVSLSLWSNITRLQCVTMKAEESNDALSIF